MPAFDPFNWSESVEESIQPPPISKEMEQIDAEISQHEHAIRALRTQRNAATLICRLPIELLCEIFIISRNAENTRIPRRRSTWFPLPQTCQYLRSVALSCPSLWAELDFDTASGWTREMLKRSKDAPLYITANFTYKPQAMREVMFEVLSKTSRLAELDLSGTSEYSELSEANKYLTQPAPFLRSLRISQHHHNKPPAIFPTDFLGADAPRLRTIDLARCAIQWDAPIFANLTSLSVKDPSPSITATPSQIVSILEKTPQLETLVLHHALANVDVSSYRTATRKSHPIRLPNLSKLDLFSDAPALTYLLFSITIPLLVNVQIAVFGPSEPDLFDFAPFITALNSCADSPTMFLHQPMEAWEFSSNFIPGGLVFRGRRTLSGLPPAVEVTLRRPYSHRALSPGYAVSQRADDLQVMLQNVADALPMSEIRELHLSGEGMISRTLGVFERCTQLATLELRGSETSFISALGVDLNPANRTKRKGKKPKAHLVFPHLQKLSICGGNFEEDGAGNLRNMLAFRERNKARVMTLELEECSRMFADDVARLRKHVGQVKWDGVENDPDEEDYDEEGYDEEGYYEGEMEYGQDYDSDLFEDLISNIYY